ncbi:MAG: hypothetical protein ABSF55_01795 [Candidatus Staskawiczbacteria bacterium]|jgi:hypothetical protein
MQLFESLIQQVRIRSEEEIKAVNETLQEFLALCAELQTKVDAVQLDGQAGPDTPVDEAAGEKVLGTMSDDLRRLSIVHNKILDDMKSECEKFHVGTVEALMKTPLSEAAGKIEDAVSDHEKVHKRVDLVNTMFWRVVGDAFPTAETDDKVSLGIRKDWQVVMAPARRESSRIIVGPPIRLPPRNRPHVGRNDGRLDPTFVRRSMICNKFERPPSIYVSKGDFLL